MNNTIYGKTKENLRNRINLKFVNNEKDYIKYISKPSYMSIQLGFDVHLTGYITGNLH